MMVLPIVQKDIQQVWPRVEAFIASAIDYSQGDYTLEQVKVYLAKGMWQLLVVVDDSSTIRGAIVVEYISRPNDRVAFVVAIGGRAIADKSGFESFCDVLRYNGATKIEGAVRDSVARLWKQKYGFSEKYTIVEVGL